MRKRVEFTTPVRGRLLLRGYHGSTSSEVWIVGFTPTRFRVRAIVRTKLAGRDRWLEPGATALVPKTAVRTDEMQPAVKAEADGFAGGQP